MKILNMSMFKNYPTISKTQILLQNLTLSDILTEECMVYNFGFSQTLRISHHSIDK